MNRSSWHTLAFLLLIGLNISLIGFLLLRPSNSGGLRNGPPRQGGAHRIDQFLKQELGWSDDQMAQFETAKDKHLQQSLEIRQTMQPQRESLMALLPHSSPDSTTIRQLTAEIGAQQSQLEQLNFDHFHELRTICTPAQQVQFDQLIGDILRQLGPPPPRRQGRR